MRNLKHVYRVEHPNGNVGPYRVTVSPHEQHSPAWEVAKQLNIRHSYHESETHPIPSEDGMCAWALPGVYLSAFIDRAQLCAWFTLKERETLLSAGFVLLKVSVNVSLDLTTNQGYATVVEGGHQCAYNRDAAVRTKVLSREFMLSSPKAA